MFTYEVFHALSDPHRRTILRLLTAGDRKVSDLADHFEISRPAVSRHLRVLRHAGLVSQQRSGRERICHLEAPVLQDAADWLYEVASRRILVRYSAEEPEISEEEHRESPSESADWKQW